MYHVCVYRGFSYNEVRVIEAPNCRQAIFEASALDSRADSSFCRFCCERHASTLEEAEKLAERITSEPN